MHIPLYIIEGLAYLENKVALKREKAYSVRSFSEKEKADHI